LPKPGCFETLIAITGMMGTIIPAAAGRCPDIASVSQPSASGEIGKRIRRASRWAYRRPGNLS
jgi:hypothetical protein